MTKTGQNFEMVAGDSKYVDITVEMDSSTLVGSGIKWSMLKFDSPVLSKTSTGSSITITAAKVFRVTLGSTDTVSLAPGQYEHEAEVTDGTGLVSTVTQGIVTITKSHI